MPCPWTCGCTFLNPWRGVQQGPCLLHWPFHRSEFWIEKICKQKKGTATRKGKTYIMCWQFCLSSNKVLRLAGKLNLLTISPRTTTGKRDMTAAAILDQVYGRGDDDDDGSGDAKRFENWGRWNIRFYLPERLGPFRWSNHLLIDVNKNSIFLLTLYHWQSQSWLWCWIVKNL